MRPLRAAAATVCVTVALAACGGPTGPTLSAEQVAGFAPVGAEWTWSTANRSLVVSNELRAGVGEQRATTSWAPAECEAVAYLPSLTMLDEGESRDPVVLLPDPDAVPEDATAPQVPTTDTATANVSDRPVVAGVRVFADASAADAFLDALTPVQENCEGGFVVTGDVPWSIRAVLVDEVEVGRYRGLRIATRGYADGFSGFAEYDATEFAMIVLPVGNTVLGVGFNYEDFTLANRTAELAVAQQYLDYVGTLGTA